MIFAFFLRNGFEVWLNSCNFAASKLKSILINSKIIQLWKKMKN